VLENELLKERLKNELLKEMLRNEFCGVLKK
jgi:hypothetical protein